MANEPLLTVVGNITDDPELRFTPSGAAVANFTVAQTPRTKVGDQWEDGETLWLRCAAWRELAENVAESLAKGTRVIVQGRLRARSYETREGEKRTSMELDVEAIGPELRWASAKVTKAQRGGGQQQGQRQQQRQADPWASPQPASDPWATPGAGNDEPPF